MSKMSWVIVAFGLSLIICDLVDASTGFGANLASATVIPCWTVGMIVIAAGLASAQGRRSLRTTGYCIGTGFPLILAAVFAWQAVMHWSVPRTGHAILVGLLALGSVAVVGLTQYFRPREGIGARGYVVPLTNKPKPKANLETTPVRRSEAG